MPPYLTLPCVWLQYTVFKELYWKFYSPNSLVAVAHDRVQLVADINEEDILKITLLGWVRKHTALMSALGKQGGQITPSPMPVDTKTKTKPLRTQVKKDNDVIPLNKQTGVMDIVVSGSKH